jgi:tRNA uridine 5-carbamoylmethylation protein Kti12
MSKGTLTLRRPVNKIIEAPRADPTPVETDGRFTNRCYVLMGLPGSGKSRWVSSALRKWKGVYPTLICEDDLIDQECRRTGESYAEVVERVDREEQQRMSQELFSAALGVRRDIIIDRHNLTEDDRSDLLLRLPDTYQKIGLIFTCPMNLLYERLQARFDETGRPFSRLVVGNMTKRFERPGPFEFDRITTIEHTCQY